ncbi:MAG: NAD(P)-binding domain-containing protein, partial [Blastocatellia bacterium]|nr:NAD(P)-binding domain-containing protein [Blastocatellia bacterium]
QAALDVFWEKRKREAGKIAEKTPLHPRGGQVFGKAQFNWRPTVDLSRLWRKSYFILGSVVVLLLSVAALLAYESAYSPGAVSEAHAKPFSRDDLLKRNVALRPNNNSCSNCHGVTTGMLDNCIGCHLTPPPPAQPIFKPATLIGGHSRQQLACTDCHIEHVGTEVKAGLVSYRLCYQCHNGEYRIKLAGDIGPAGTALPIPHGGTTGYTKVKRGEKGGEYWEGLTADRWRRSIARWQKVNPQINADPASLAASDSDNQFHKLHLGGIDTGSQQSNQMCVICHFDKSGRVDTKTDFGLHEAPRQACAKCHAISYTAESKEDSFPQAAREPANCKTCHQQHGESEEVISVARIIAEPGKEKEFLDTLNQTVEGIDNTAGPRGHELVGGADVLRQNRDVVTLANISANFGALPWYGWAAIISIVPIVGLFVMIAGGFARKSHLKAASREVKPGEDIVLTGGLDLDKLAAEGPAYPHPVINQQTCIGCHACVDACPHDVLAIVNGKSTPVALDQCMEDTSCQVECPTNPKSCIVVNTSKKIPARKVPTRDGRFKTNVEGIYLIGDVSGTPLIKNAINEGRRVIDAVLEDIKKDGPNSSADYDVAIIGVGPAGLSTAVLAKQEGLRYVALEQDNIVATIQTYQAGKFVFFTPPDKEVLGGIPLVVDPERPEGNTKEAMMQGWFDAMMQNGVEIHEEEGCKDIKNEGGVFHVHTEKGKTKEKVVYKARKIILAIGNKGVPMKLGVPGEELTIRVQPPPQVANHCPKCGSARKGTQLFCVQCGQQLPTKTLPPFEDSKVQYKLSDPRDYVNKKCIVVGAGNSAIEVAVGLTGFERDGDDIKFTSDTEVTLIIRSDFKGDLALGNKMAVYDCIDSGRMKVFFGCTIREITKDEVVIMTARSKEEKARMKNDYIFALIGGEKPTKFLESLGIKIGAEG